MRPLARFVVRSPRPQATDSRRDVDCYRLKENERSERAARQRRTAHVGFLARLEEADDGRGRRDGRWTRAWTDKLSPPYVVIDSARGQDAITPNSALKRPGRREGGREGGRWGERGREKKSERTNERAYHTDFGRRLQVILHLGRQRTSQVLGSEDGREVRERTHRARGSQISRFGSAAVSTVRPSRPRAVGTWPDRGGHRGQRSGQLQVIYFHN